MVYEFEGKTERDAIENASHELGIDTDEFDVEIVETQKNGIFKKGKVKIRVHVHSDAEKRVDSPARPSNSSELNEQRVPVVPDAEFEAKITEFIENTITKMGYTSKISILFREEKKLGIRIESENASILIGKKGKNLDALQLIVNVYAGRLGHEDTRVILDSENYRIRREESLVRLAYETAERVRQRRQSVLLEPMNPFERRIIHTTLNDILDIETKSEGEGLYKQVRVLPKGRF